MSPSTPEPRPGRYLDSCDTPYEATKHPKNGWHLKKLARADPGPLPQAFPLADFPAAVNAGRFTYQPEIP